MNIIQERKNEKITKFINNYSFNNWFNYNYFLICIQYINSFDIKMKEFRLYLKYSGLGLLTAGAVGYIWKGNSYIISGLLILGGLLFISGMARR